MMRYTAISAAFWSSLRRSSAPITSSVRALRPLSPASARPAPSVFVPSPVTASIRPACARSVSADRSSPSEIALSTRTDGWCRPRSTWLRYGFDKLVSSASWRSDRFAILRWVRMKAPSASRCPFHGSVTVTSSSSANYSTRKPPCPRLPRTMCCDTDASLGGCAVLLALLLLLLLRAVVAARHQRSRRLQQFLGELTLAREKLLGEIVGAGHYVLRLGQPGGERCP